MAEKNGAPPKDALPEKAPKPALPAKAPAPRRRIRVLEIVGNAIVGGMETYVRNLIAQLPPDVFEVTCLCPFESPFTTALRERDVPVYVTPMPEDPSWRSIQAAVELIRQERVGLIHAHLPNAHALATLAGGLTQTPVVATLHGMHLTSTDVGICRVGSTQLIVVCQAALLQALALGLPRGRVTHIPNGVDTRAFAPRPRTGALHAELGMPEDAPLVGYVARLSWEKGPDDFLRAAARVRDEIPEAHFVLVGEGPMAEELVGLAGSLGLEEHAHLLGAREDVAALYAEMDLVASTSRMEGMPLVLLEAMASGRPIVAMSVGGVPELVEAGRTGVLVGGDDWAEAGRVVVELLRSPERRAEMGLAARERAERQFDLNVSVRRVASLFRRLAATDRAAVRVPAVPVVKG